MDITLLYFNDCPNWKDAEAHLNALTAENPDLTFTHQTVETAEEAERLGFHGSPSIHIDGIDPFADDNAAISLSCRIYQTPDGPAGAPTLDQLRQALAVD